MRLSCRLTLRVAGCGAPALAHGLLALCLAGLPAAAGAQATAGTRAAGLAAPARNGDIALWRATARERIRSQWTVPPSVPGATRTELEILLLPSGNAADVSTRRRSGLPEFDSAARRAVLAATPLPVPADAAGYERVRRFAAIFDANGSVQLADVQALAAPAPAPAVAGNPGERFVCTVAGSGPLEAPDCSQRGSRVALLTCYAQAVQRRATQLVGACAATAYPLEARRDHREGTVQIALAFAHGGKPAGLSVVQSSGQPLLDQRALEIVQAALVPPPAELHAVPFAVRVPVMFRLGHAEGR